jgi:hypothetical protein
MCFTSLVQFEKHGSGTRFLADGFQFPSAGDLFVFRLMNATIFLIVSRAASMEQVRISASSL